MLKRRKATWESRIVEPARALEEIKPGMRIFVGTGVVEPRALVRALQESDDGNLQDLELIQLVSMGDAISWQGLSSGKYRLKTFFAGWVASEAIRSGQVDLIPSRFSRIPRLIQSGRIRIDAAFVQISPPDEASYCSLGPAVDVARQALEQASLKVGEINPDLPRTSGDTYIRLEEFDLLVRAHEPPLTFPRWPVAEVFEQVAGNVASLVEDGSCLGFSIGPLFEALGKTLASKRHLGIHSPFLTDAVMDLVCCGAVTNRRKETFRGKSVASYALGTPELMDWLDGNPLVEFQATDKVFSPIQIGRNSRFVAVFPARKVDLTGRLALQHGKGLVAAGPGEAIDFLNGAELSPGGRAVFGLPSRNREGKPNIRLSVTEFPNRFAFREVVDAVATEYGVAYLSGRTVRERAQALIDIAHPDDRERLVEEARAAKILYPDQIFVPQSAHLYPADLETAQSFGDATVTFRALKPSDEEEMRRLFYRFSSRTVYYRYFSPINSMPHARMQSYVNIDYQSTLSLVGLVGEPGEERIIAEGRFARYPDRPAADLAFVVEEDYQGRGIATALFKQLIPLARARGIETFAADVLASNRAMIRVIEKMGLKARARLAEGVYEMEIPLNDGRQR